MKRQKIAGIFADAEDLGGRSMTVCGWVRTVRDLKNFGFIFRDVVNRNLKSVFGGNQSQRLCSAADLRYRLNRRIRPR